MEEKFLRLHLFQPSANYRLPYAYQRRLTYPLPPYSTVLGFLTNLVKDHPSISRYLEQEKKQLPISGIAICGRFLSKVSEYIWFRGFGHKDKASKGEILRYRMYGLPEHPGKQLPGVVEVLENVEVVVYLASKKSDFLKNLMDALKSPKPYEIPHLGRAEDLVMLRSVALVNVEKDQILYRGRWEYNFWVPYEQATELKLEGLLYRISLEAWDERGTRQVRSVPVLFWEGVLPYSIRVPYLERASKKKPSSEGEKENSFPETDFPIFLQQL